jgi:hypothetical protein
MKKKPTTPKTPVRHQQPVTEKELGTIVGGIVSPRDCVVSPRDP